MGLADDILRLRDQHFSSVAQLISALESVCEAPPEKVAIRVFAASAAADLVLTNVAAHASDALKEFSAPAATPHTIRTSRRKRHTSQIIRPPRQHIAFARQLNDRA